MALTQNEMIERIAKYGIVGLVSNGILYVLYLVMTFVGVSPLIATSIAFAMGVTGTFFANRNWTFSSDTSVGRGSVKYIIAYGIGYLGQVSTLFVLTEKIAIPHQISQLVAMGVAAVIIFTMLQLWVFKASSPDQ